MAAALQLNRIGTKIGYRLMKTNAWRALLLPFRGGRRRSSAVVYIKFKQRYRKLYLTLPPTYTPTQGRRRKSASFYESKRQWCFSDSLCAAAWLCNHIAYVWLYLYCYVLLVQLVSLNISGQPVHNGFFSQFSCSRIMRVLDWLTNWLGLIHKIGIQAMRLFNY